MYRIAVSALESSLTRCCARVLRGVEWCGMALHRSVLASSADICSLSKQGSVTSYAAYATWQE
jgi:hypothetical protein